MKKNVIASIIASTISLFVFANETTATEIDTRVNAILRQMTLEEKIDYIGGHDNFYIRAIPRLNVPELKMADGPVGVRNYGPAASYPAGICMAATWNPALVEQFGVMLGKDARARGAHFMLAPGMNMYRMPLCGRNFEYFGEDPYLASKMAVASIKGIQSQGVIATAKHFACNNQEWNRYQVSSDVDERTLRELYLPAFEACVKEGNVGAIMNSYNLLNGTYAAQNGMLNLDIAKKEWAFRGIIMSDWTSVYDGLAAANNGLDLEMPYGKYMNRQTLLPAIQSGVVTEQVIDDKVRRVLRTAMEFGFFDRPQKDENSSLFNQEARKVALEIAQEGMVLLKNMNLLPLDKTKIKSIAVIGPRAEQDIPQGSGSSKVAPMIRTSFLSALSDSLDTETSILYARGIPDLTAAFDENSFVTTICGKENGLVGEYFDNMELKGNPHLSRIDSKVKFQWGEMSYRPNGPINHYSVRWTGYYVPKLSGDATFYITGNDGFRLFIDDKMLINHWHDDGESFQWKTEKLEAGKHYKVCLEYYVDKGGQTIEFGVAKGRNSSIEEAKKTAEKADYVILCVGFDAKAEGEYWDRSFKLPEAQNELIKEVLSVNKNTVVVLTAGGNVDMSSWIESVPALLYAWYPGQEGGKALAKILFGDISPSGKLPASFEQKLSDNPAYVNYYDKDNNKRVTYSEGIFTGYRHYDKSSTKPLFPFGFGLSYTTFSYANLTATPSIQDGVVSVLVSFDVTNSGKKEGAEIAQVYVGDPASKVVRPIKELKGFSKVYLEPGETKTITLSLNERAFSYYDVQNKKWTYDAGEFQILVGGSSDKIALTQPINLPQDALEVTNKDM